MSGAETDVQKRELKDWISPQFFTQYFAPKRHSMIIQYLINNLREESAMTVLTSQT